MMHGPMNVKGPFRRALVYLCVCVCVCVRVCLRPRISYWVLVMKPVMTSVSGFHFYRQD